MTRLVMKRPAIIILSFVTILLALGLITSWIVLGRQVALQRDELGRARQQVAELDREQSSVAANPEQYQYGLVDVWNEDRSLIVDQYIKQVDRRTGRERIVLNHIYNLIPELGRGAALAEYARPADTAIIVFVLGPRGDSDALPGSGRLVAYDAAANTLLPRFNQPPPLRVLAPDGRHLVAVLVDAGGEGIELVSYDMAQDELKRLVTLTSSESFSKNYHPFGGITDFEIQWKDNRTIEYSVFLRSRRFDLQTERTYPDRPLIRRETISLLE